MMSLKTWKKEFYPVTAKRCPKKPIRQAQQGVLEWTGLLPGNLKKHGLVKAQYGTVIYERECVGRGFPVGGQSCALCANCHPDGRPVCGQCILVIYLGHRCHAQYDIWIRKNDAHPMLRKLKRLEQVILKADQKGKG